MKKRILTTFLAGIMCLALFLPMGCDLGYVYKGNEEKVKKYEKAFEELEEKYKGIPYREAFKTNGTRV